MGLYKSYFTFSEMVAAHEGHNRGDVSPYIGSRDARRRACRAVLEGFDSLEEAREFHDEVMTPTTVLFTDRGREFNKRTLRDAIRIARAEFPEKWQTYGR